LIENTELDKALQWIQQRISELDEYLSNSKPWTLTGEEQKAVLSVAVTRVVEIAYHLQPFMPNTAKTILEHFTAEKITALSPLFPRIETTHA
jgi:methionyl-tRNA synthetase